MDEPFVDRVWRRYLDNEGPFGDGWATVIAGVLYPVVAVGLPAVAAIGGRRLSIENAFLAGVLGLAAAFFLDYAALGVAFAGGL